MIIVITATAINTAAVKHITHMIRNIEDECEASGEDSVTDTFC
jgi:hypothetical protein